MPWERIVDIPTFTFYTLGCVGWVFIIYSAISLGKRYVKRQWKKTI